MRTGASVAALFAKKSRQPHNLSPLATCHSVSAAAALVANGQPQNSRLVTSLYLPNGFPLFCRIRISDVRRFWSGGVGCAIEANFLKRPINLFERFFTKV